MEADPSLAPHRASFIQDTGDLAGYLLLLEEKKGQGDQEKNLSLTPQAHDAMALNGGQQPFMTI
jgi:hypothetical protein